MNSSESSVSDATGSDATAEKELPFDLGGVHFSQLQSGLLMGYVVVLIVFTIASNAFVILAVSSHSPLRCEK